MKMFLTRLGFGSRAVITGDITQVDLPRGQQSGLAHALRVLENIKEIHITRFHSRDVVRHQLVQKLLKLMRGGMVNNSVLMLKHVLNVKHAKKH